jgi:hypothetical protein
LLNVTRGVSCEAFDSPVLRHGPVAQLHRAPLSYSGGWGLESLPGHMEERKLEDRAARRVHPETGHITMYLADVPWGPIMTAPTEEECMEKMRWGMAVCRIVNDMEMLIHKRLN